MRQETVDSWLAQADDIMKLELSARSDEGAQQLHQFTVSMLAAFHGENSPHLRSYLATISGFTKEPGMRTVMTVRAAKGALQTLVREIRAGLVVNVRSQVQGEVIGDLVALAREILSWDDTEQRKNVAAVLTAAAFEDLLRRLGESKANIVGRPKLDQVVESLKQAGVVRGGNLTLCVGNLKFRNDALHADWPKIPRNQVESCLLLVEALLSEYMS